MPRKRIGDVLASSLGSAWWDIRRPVIIWKKRCFQEVMGSNPSTDKGIFRHEISVGFNHFNCLSAFYLFFMRVMFYTKKMRSFFKKRKTQGTGAKFKKKLLGWVNLILILDMFSFFGLVASLNKPDRILSCYPSIDFFQSCFSRIFVKMAVFQPGTGTQEQLIGGKVASWTDSTR